jgi:predicted small secreted protein
MATCFRRILMLSVLSLLPALTACGDTWYGLKKDTGQNIEATGKAIEKVGDKVTP